MAHAVVDEAIRNVVAVGADPDQVALLDNFSWGDPRRPSTLGELVAAVRGCHDAALAYGAPFVSGKDSLNNEYTGADGQRHAVPPTLVITAVAHVPDVGRCVTAELTAPGNVLFLLGRDGAGVRRQPPRPRARRARRSPAPRRSPTPTRPAATAACTRRSATGSCRRATTSARAGSPSPSPSCASPAASAPSIDALPHDDVATALFAESIGRLVVEVAPTTSSASSPTVGAAVRPRHGDAPSPRCLASAIPVADSPPPSPSRRMTSAAECLRIGRARRIDRRSG